jgi:hypothetical protein
MKRILHTGLVLFAVAVAGCSGTTSTTAASDRAAANAAAPTPVTLDANAALQRLEASVPVARSTRRGITQPVDLASLPAQLQTRFTNAKAAVEDFAFRHTDQGNDDSGIAYVLDAPGSSRFIGFVVFAAGGDDADRYSADAIAYYTTDGGLLDLQTRASGISDSEDAGDWTNADLNALDGVKATLKRAVKYDAAKQSVELVKSKTTAANADALPFAALVKTVQAEIESSTFAHSDQGDDATRFVSVTGADGAVAGFILESDGSDDADHWFSAGYALFSATGQLLDRQISTAGVADTMDDDSVKLESR